MHAPQDPHTETHADECVVWSQHSMEEEDMMSDLRVAWQKVR
jgi:hypothetical protein